MDIKEVLYENYMPYAEGVILDRAVPQIDGLKPVNRRILYAMHKLRLEDKRRKAAGIVGEVMKYHPNGDAAIYDAMVRMVDSHGALLAPPIKGKGNYGKAHSKNLAYAASRYPEASLMPIAAEFFDGIEDDAVDIVDNFDSTAKEPVLLPVKFPSVLVNTSSGIAVGVASRIPSFNLRAVCKATEGILRGQINDSDELMDAMGAPDFACGGCIHVDKRELYQLGRTGRAGFYVSAACRFGRGIIVVDQVPFGAYVEDIVEDIKEHMKVDLKEVDSVKDLTDINGMRIEILLKPGYDSRKVLDKLRKMTDLTKRVSFNTAVIVNGEYKQKGILEILEDWIAFRETCIKRMYTKKYNDLAVEEHRLAAFEAISGRLDEANEIMKLPEFQAEFRLKAVLGLDDEQAKYLGDCKRKDFYADRIAKRLQRLADVRATMKVYAKIRDDQQERYKLMCSELEEVANKYGEARRTEEVEPLELNFDAEAPQGPDHGSCVVMVTEQNNLIRLTTPAAISTFVEDPNDKVRWRLATHNDSTVLLFTVGGICYKIKVDDIAPSTKRHPKEYVYSLARKEDNYPFIWAETIEDDDWSGGFNVVYGNGRGTYVNFQRLSGNRKAYHSLWELQTGTNLCITKETKFFLITKRKKAAYADLSYHNAMKLKGFKITAIRDDELDYILPLTEVPYYDLWTPDKLEKYRRGWPVLVRNDMLWWPDTMTPEQVELAKANDQKRRDMKAAAATEKANEEQSSDDGEGQGWADGESATADPNMQAAEAGIRAAVMVAQRGQ